MKQIQSLPDITHSSAVLALLGILPLEKVIHKNMLNLFGRWIASDGIERDIAERQLAMKSVTEHSWFNRIKLLLEIYKLSAASHLMDNVPTRSKWKKMVYKAINLTVETQWREDIGSRSSLRYINPESVKVGKSHHILSSVHNNLHDSRRAQLKSCILTGTYTLQSNCTVFNQFAVDPTCKLCDKGPDTRQQLLAECQTLQHVRQKFFTRIQHIVDPSGLDIASPCEVTQLILHSSVFFKSKTIIDSCELYSRELICSLHQTRNKLLSGNEKQQGLTVSNLNPKLSRANFSRHQNRRIAAKKSTSTPRLAVK